MVELLTRPRRGTEFRPRERATAAPAGSAQPELPEVTIDELVAMFKLLADDTRLRILYYLTRQPEMHVRALCDLLGQSQPAVSHHLALLKEARLLDRRREGKHNFYSLRTGRITELLDQFFARLPEHQRQLRVADYLLSHAPA